jgi:hypothetical protein
VTDADLLRRILGAMRPDIPIDWHDQAWLAAKGLATLEAIEADAVTLAATPAPLDGAHLSGEWEMTTCPLNPEPHPHLTKKGTRS